MTTSDEVALALPDPQTLATLPDPEMAALAIIERGRAAIAEAETLEEAQKIFGQTKVLEAAIRAIELTKACIVDAGELRVRAERRVGQLTPSPLSATQRGQRGGRGHKANDEASPALSAGQRKRATRTKKLADALDDAKFEKALAETKAAALAGEANMTSETVLRKAMPQHKPDDGRAQRRRLRDKFDERVENVASDAGWLAKNAESITGTNNELDRWVVKVAEAAERLTVTVKILQRGEPDG